MCTLKLLKALCSVLVTTKIESPVKVKDGSVTLRFLKCPRIEILTCWHLIGIVKSSSGKAGNRNGHGQRLNQVQLRDWFRHLARQENRTGWPQGKMLLLSSSFSGHQYTNIHSSGPQILPFFYERKMNSDVYLLVSTEAEFHKKDAFSSAIQCGLVH